jgi:hypothetical protein
MAESEQFHPKFHPAVAGVLDFFQHQHLDGVAKTVAEEYAVMAERVANRAPADPETTVALRKLLESKDAAVRAALRSSWGVDRA